MSEIPTARGRAGTGSWTARRGSGMRIFEIVLRVQSVDDMKIGTLQLEEYDDEKKFHCIFQVGWSHQKFAGSLAAREMTSDGVTHRPDSR